MLKYEHLQGIPFSHGQDDCFNIIRRFFFDNFGIEIRNYARPDDWWEHGFNFYVDNLEKEGFEIVQNDSPRNLRPADVFLIAIRSPVANHSAIHLGNGQILHHFYNRLSEVSPYRGVWRNNTMAVVRHKDVPDLTAETEEVDLMNFLPPHKRRLIENATG